MSEHEHRLVQCFASALPAASEEEIRACNVAALVDLDSLAGVTLVIAIDQEFGVFVDISTLLELGSFEAIAQHLQERSPAGVLAHERGTR